MPSALGSEINARLLLYTDFLHFTLETLLYRCTIENKKDDQSSIGPHCGAARVNADYFIRRVGADTQREDAKNLGAATRAPVTFQLQSCPRITFI